MQQENRAVVGPSKLSQGDAQASAPVVDDDQAHVEAAIQFKADVDAKKVTIFAEADLLTGKVVMRRTIAILPLTDRVLKLVNRWGQMTRTLQYESRLEFLDRHQKRYDWDNEELIVDTEQTVSHHSIAHLDVPADPPDITFENEIVPDGAVDRVLTSENEISHAARVNAGISSGNPAQSTGVSQQERETIDLSLLPEESSQGGEDNEEPDEKYELPHEDEDGPVDTQVAQDAPPLGSVYNETGVCRSVRQRRTPSTYEPSH